MMNNIFGIWRVFVKSIRFHFSNVDLHEIFHVISMTICFLIRFCKIFVVFCKKIKENKFETIEISVNEKKKRQISFCSKFIWIFSRENEHWFIFHRTTNELNRNIDPIEVHRHRHRWSNQHVYPNLLDVDVFRKRVEQFHQENVLSPALAKTLFSGRLHVHWPLFDWLNKSKWRG